jgi:23S rRNA (pseudouridine1915-N3)-methyltransferase
MKIKLLLTGKTTDSNIKSIMADYEKRLTHYINFEILVLDNSSIKADSEEKIKTKEGELILKKIATGDHVILLDEQGKTFTSVEFSKEINQWMNQSRKSIVFVVGGAYGFSEEVKKRSNGSISLSKMTFSHQIVRAIFLEQIYRAFTILNNEPYHHQ